MQRIFIYSWVVIILWSINSCTSYERDLQHALNAAGENRAELEKVLSHYSVYERDSMKLRAARFLIENMPQHESYPAVPYKTYCMALDSVFQDQTTDDDRKMAIADSLSQIFTPLLVPVKDIEVITADYLIWNIDYSFEVWQSSNFLRHLTFDEFCEYVLPYKCLDLQPITHWKEEWRDVLRGELDQITQIYDFTYNERRAVEAVTWYYRDADTLVKMNTYQDKEVDFAGLLCMPTLAMQPYVTCLERSQFGLMTCRSKGIPVSLDFTPNWADRKDKHCWNHVYTGRRQGCNYEPIVVSPGTYHFNDNLLAKVYRQSYAPHPLLKEAKEAGELLPVSLSQIFIRDVTEEYGCTADIEIELIPECRNKYLYLSVFDNAEWVPVDIGRQRKGKVFFKNVGLDILYMVTAYNGRRQIAVSDPFIVDVCKEVQPIVPTSDTIQNMRLYRKYPAYQHIYSGYPLLQGGLIEASHDSLFTHPVEMVKFPMDWFLAGESTITDTTAYRYWRLKSSTSRSADFAEIYFYDRDSMKRLSWDFIPQNIGIRDSIYDTQEHIRDNDPLSFLAVDNAADPIRWTGFDFGRPVSISKVAYIRRGDGNDICPGDEYALYYWEAGRWLLHDRKTADNIYIDFENVPAGRLYHIVGLSRGKQNRTFLYEDGKVKWY